MWQGDMVIKNPKKITNIFLYYLYLIISYSIEGGGNMATKVSLSESRE